MLLERDQSQLVLIDYQARLMPAIQGHEEVLKNAMRLAKLAKKLHIPVFGTEQTPEKLGELPQEMSSLCKSVLRKSHFSACPDGLLDMLEKKPVSGNARSLPRHIREKQNQSPERESLVLAGVEAHICLLQTALDLLSQDKEVWIVTDACGSRTDRNRDAAFDRLASCGAELLTTEMVMYEWLLTSDDEDFKFALELVK